MRVTAVMMFFAERPRELKAQVQALAGFCDRVVGADGRWDGFPGARVASDIDDSVVIMETAERAGIDVTVHRPARPWEGELAHRNYALRLALADADWIMLVDADERVTQADPAARPLLEATDLDAATVSFHTLEGPRKTFTQWETPGRTVYQRKLFRAHPALRFDTHHWWLTDGSQALWGEMPDLPLAPALDLPVRVEHRTCLRTAERWERKARYVPERDAADEARGYEL